MNEHRKRIGQQLADLRKERGLSGEQLAEKIGKCHQTVYKVERGAWAVSVDILEEFCDALDAELVVRKRGNCTQKRTYKSKAVK